MFGDERATEAALAFSRDTRGAQNVLFIYSFLYLIFFGGLGDQPYYDGP